MRNQFTTYFGGDRLAHFAQISKMMETYIDVNVSLVRQGMRATSREQAFGDLEITDTHRAAIIASVNYALQHPNEAPEQVVRQQAILEPLS